VLLAVAEALAEVADAVTKVVGVAELELWVLEAADEGATDDEEEAEEGEAELTTLASTTSALPLAEEEEEDEEDSLPTPALVLRAVTSSAEVAFHTESAEPTA
jgi:hypothetical protein